MSNREDKERRERRIHQANVHIKKQVKIAKSHGMDVTEQHRFDKHHAMDCGNPKCMMCGNPRKVFRELTAQEKRMYQDTDKITDKHSNGLRQGDDDND